MKQYRTDDVESNYYWTLEDMYGKHKSTVYGTRIEAEKEANKMADRLKSTIGVFSPFGYHGAIYPD